MGHRKKRRSHAREQPAAAPASDDRPTEDGDDSPPAPDAAGSDPEPQQPSEVPPGGGASAVVISPPQPRNAEPKLPEPTADPCGRLASCALPPYWYIGRDARSHPPPGGRRAPLSPLPPIAPMRPSLPWHEVVAGEAGCAVPPGWTAGRGQRSLPPGRVPPVAPAPDLTDELEQRSPFQMRRPAESAWGSAEPDPPEPGVCGLYNLGNTCFMNAVLQCLAHCGLLAAYFLSGAYERDINRTNLLGHKGELATHYAKLLRKQWSGRHAAIAPREFRMALAAFCPLLQDMGQHDAQEFLMILLDGLHEDLNLVKDKPYLSDKMEGDEGCDDAVLASYAWHQYQRRNRSFIVDTFQGQLKSTIRCNRCDKVSVTFDPVTFFTLPAQTAIDTYVVIPVLYRSRDFSEPLRRYSCRLLRTALLLDLQSCLAGLVGVPRQTLLIRDVFQCRVWSAFQHDETVDVIRPGDEIVAYQVDCPPEPDGPAAAPPAPPWVVVTLLHFIPDGGWKRALLPMVVALPAATPISGLYAHVDAHLPAALRAEGDSDDEAAQRLAAAAYRFTLARASREGALLDAAGQPSRDGAELRDPNVTLSHLQRGRPTPEDGLTLAVKWQQPPDPRLFNVKVDDASVERNEQWQEQCRRRTQLTLDDCWRAFIEEEQLGADNMWYCAKCGAHRAAFKRLQLFRVPRLLIVHLKRFQYTGNYRRKVDSLVDYPLTGLDLAPYIAQPLPPGTSAIYDLIGVTHHLGGSIEFGHYTACARHANTDRWYAFDDSRAELCEAEDLQPTPSAYLLFYRLRD
eukprot:EG_transcript_2618